LEKRPNPAFLRDRSVTTLDEWEDEAAENHQLVPFNNNPHVVILKYNHSQPLTICPTARRKESADEIDTAPQQPNPPPSSTPAKRSRNVFYGVKESSRNRPSPFVAGHQTSPSSNHSSSNSSAIQVTLNFNAPEFQDSLNNAVEKALVNNKPALRAAMRDVIDEGLDGSNC